MNENIESKKEEQYKRRGRILKYIVFLIIGFLSGIIFMVLSIIFILSFCYDMVKNEILPVLINEIEQLLSI